MWKYDIYRKENYILIKNKQFFTEQKGAFMSMQNFLISMYPFNHHWWVIGFSILKNTWQPITEVWVWDVKYPGDHHIFQVSHNVYFCSCMKERKTFWVNLDNKYYVFATLWFSQGSFSTSNKQASSKGLQPEGIFGGGQLRVTSPLNFIICCGLLALPIDLRAWYAGEDSIVFRL